LNIQDNQSKAESEELDRAIALSLAEENKHPKGKYFYMILSFWSSTTVN
jgi:hypothetical protein